jgi:multidrug efflux pump subunit AcrA (membrane-fusion protein)
LIYVPVAAVLEGDGGRATVYVLSEGKAVQRRVEVAFISRAGVALRAGVTAGEQVITTGAAYVRDGDAVKLP